MIIANISNLKVSVIEEKYRSPHYLGIRLENEISDNFIDSLSKNNILSLTALLMPSLKLSNEFVCSCIFLLVRAQV